jgi:hypothetical protein
MIVGFFICTKTPFYSPIRYKKVSYSVSKMPQKTTHRIARNILIYKVFRN